MFENYRFQMDVDDPSSWLLYYRLRDIFRHADPDNLQPTFDAIQDVIESRNVEDLSQQRDSPYRHKPAYLVEGTYAMKGETVERPLPKIDPATQPKDWSQKTWEPPPKDWSKLTR